MSDEERKALENRILELEIKATNTTSALIFVVSCLIELGQSADFPSKTRFWEFLGTVNSTIDDLLGEAKKPTDDE